MRDRKTCFGLGDRLDFGTRRRQVWDLIQSNPQYLKWCYETIPWFDLDKEAKAKLESMVGRLQL